MVMDNFSIIYLALLNYTHLHKALLARKISIYERIIGLRCWLKPALNFWEMDTWMGEYQLKTSAMMYI